MAASEKPSAEVAEHHRIPRRRALWFIGGTLVGGAAVLSGTWGIETAVDYFSAEPTEYPAEWLPVSLDMSSLPHVAFNKFPGATKNRSTWGVAVFGLEPAYLQAQRDRYGEGAGPAVVFGRGAHTKIANLGSFDALAPVAEPGKQAEAYAIAVELGDGDLEVSLGLTRGGDPATFASSAGALRWFDSMSRHDLAHAYQDVKLLTTAA